MRELLKFVADRTVAKDLRELIENDQTIVIVGPHRATNLAFFKLVCQMRLPNSIKVGLAKPEDGLDFDREHYPDIRLMYQTATLNHGNFVATALAQDPDGLLITDLTDEALETFFTALESGRTAGTTAIVDHNDIRSALESWQAHDSESVPLLLSHVLLSIFFVELQPVAEFTPVAALAVAHVGAAGIEIEYRVRRHIRPYIPGRDPALEKYFRFYEYDRKLITGAARKSTGQLGIRNLQTADDIRHSEKITPEDEISEEFRKLLRPAFVPICVPLSDDEKFRLDEHILNSPDWPRSSPELGKLHLWLQIQSESLPPMLREHIGKNRVLRLFYALDEQTAIVEDPTSVLRAIMIDKDVLRESYPSDLPLDVVRENFRLQELVQFADGPEWIEEEGSNITAESGTRPLCYGGNKFQGWPRWLRAAEYPLCRQCGTKMLLFMQIYCLSHEFHFYLGESANGYVFYCPNHSEEWALVQQKR